MNEIPQLAFVRFRAIGEAHRQAVSIANDIVRRLEDARRRLRWLQGERERLLAPRVTGFGLGGRLAVAEPPDTSEIDRQIAGAKGEITLLTAEMERAEGRKNETGELLGRCSAILLDRGAERRQLEF